MQKIIDSAVLLDGTKIQLEDWHSENNDKAKEIFNKYNYSDSKYWTYNRMISTYRKMIQKFIKEVS